MLLLLCKCIHLRIFCRKKSKGNNKEKLLMANTTSLSVQTKANGLSVKFKTIFKSSQMSKNIFDLPVSTIVTKLVPFLVENTFPSLYFSESAVDSECNLYVCTQVNSVPKFHSSTTCTKFFSTLKCMN